MKKFLMMVLLLLPGAVMAQDTASTVSPSMFNQYRLYHISTAKGWLFKQGNDTTWAKKDVDVRGWQKLAPASIDAKYADKNGRAEGWFRLKIKIDNRLTDKSFGVKSAVWAAEDIYVDGHLITSYGNTGLNGKPYREAGIFGHLAVPIPFDLNPGSEHVIALHFVDYVSPVPPRRLKSADGGLITAIVFTRTGYNTAYFQYAAKQRMFEAIWVSVGSVLTLLFWLLFIQNPLEKNLKLIALDTTAITLGILIIATSENIGLSNSSWLILSFLNNICTPTGTLLGLLVFIRVFNRQVVAWVKIFFGANIAILTFTFFLPQDIGNLVFAVSLFITFGIEIYYVISSWKNLHGAQWAIVVGLIVSFTFGGVYTYLVVLNGSNNLDVIQICITGYSLSFPLSLLVYVSMRFKEIITEVRQNAAQVVQLSEEKKEEALNRQKVLEEEVNRQTAEIRATLDNLRATQTQLIQSEKMASLGELTAGIAHEIQNPLNFVNNFSEVSAELVDEMEEELDKGDVEEAKAIASDVKQNLEKIRHHGKRADAIVKGMLQHSQSGSGAKEPTNINALTDEYMRLAYHGLRAKDKSFNAELVAHLDETLPKINVIQQDIVRVLLNLFNNSFYAVNQKQKTMGADYKPEVSVSTSSENGQAIIRVKDNGIGIPDAIKEKIIQPFFTTKPTGEGTGLGLSLAYDMVVKGHGGFLDVMSKDGEGSEFIIKLPII
jgi:two-component system NtrC family sensor kinase